MTSFRPLKTYICRVIDRLIDHHKLVGPFLDAGCGQGDVALHLAQRGWTGLAVDSAALAVKSATIRLMGTDVKVEERDLLTLEGQFSTIISCTVVEHVKDDQQLLTKFNEMLRKGGYLILSVPINPETEWRWDDVFYGHYRRYTKSGLENILKNSGFKIIEFEDYTFPIFWAMRRIYTRLFPAKTPSSTRPGENSARSSLQDAWEAGIFSRLISALPIWNLIFWIQHRCRQDRYGFEALILAQKC